MVQHVSAIFDSLFIWYPASFCQEKWRKKLAEKNWAVPPIYQVTSGFRTSMMTTEFSVMSNVPNKNEIPGCIGFQYGELQNLKNSEP